MKRAFVIAMENEADAVRPHLKPDDRLYVSGIGKVNAAAMTMKAICEGADEIWNAGLCGGLDPAMKIGDVYEVESAVEYDFDLATLNGTTVGQLNERDSPYIPCTPLGKFPARKLATGDRFNDNEDDFKLLESLGTTLRDMEGAAVAHVCEKFGVRFVSIKCVSDVHGKGAMTDQFLTNLSNALERLSAALAEIV